MPRPPVSAAAFPFRCAGSTPTAIPLDRFTPVSQSIGRSYPSRRHRDPHCALPGPSPHPVQAASRQLRAHRHNRRENQIPIAPAARTGGQTPRDFVPRRFLDAGSLSVRRVSSLPASKNLHNTGHSPTAWRTCQIDPKLPFEVGPTNSRYALESGLRANASVARIAFPAERVNPKKRLGHRAEGRLKRRTAHERNTERRAAEVANNASERRNRCRLRGFLACR
jgi:hypothetical protein